MDAPNTSAYILATSDSVNLPNSRTLTASGGLSAEDSGPTNSVDIRTVGKLSGLNLFSSAGFVNYNIAAQQFVPITFTAGDGISITNPDGQVGDTSFSVIPGSTLQRVQVQVEEVVQGERAAINFKQGPNTIITAEEQPLDGRIDITIATSSSFAPETAKYIVQTPNVGLSSAQALSNLTPDDNNRILKVTTGGVIATAVAGTDYQPASAHLSQIAGLSASSGELIVGTGTTFGGIAPGPAGTVLTSTGTAADWLPAPGGGGWIIQNITSAPPGTIIVQPNTLYVVGNGATAFDASFILGAFDFSRGQQAMITTSGPTGAINIGVNVVPPNTVRMALDGLYDRTSVTFDSGLTGFINLMFVGLSPGSSYTYQILTYDNVTIA